MYHDDIKADTARYSTARKKRNVEHGQSPTTSYRQIWLMTIPTSELVKDSLSPAFDLRHTHKLTNHLRTEKSISLRSYKLF